MLALFIVLFLIENVSGARLACNNRCCAGYERNSAFVQTADTACVLCRAGYACPYNELPVQCGSGFFSLEGASACTPVTVCGIGYYESVAPTTQNDRGCSACVTSCAAGQYISGQPCTTADRKISPPKCEECLKTCSAGYYFTFVCSGTQTESNQCAPCSSGGCSPGYYRSQCSVASDGACTACKTCAAGKYNSGCGGNTDGTCVSCTVCAVGQAAVRECSNLQNRVCANGLCTVGSNCGELYCNYGISPVASCNLQWATEPVTGGGWICLQSTSTGTCTPCPIGWTALGGAGECTPCAKGWSCDELGVQVQSTDCSVNQFPVYVSLNNDIVCRACNLNTTALLAQSNAVLSRGGIYSSNVTYAQSQCAAYTACVTGYVLNASSTSTKCVPCSSTGAGRVFVSHGLTTNDVYSCMSRAAAVSTIGNSAGFYGSLQTKCRAGYTSVAGIAGAASDCFLCPLQPSHGSVSVSSAVCAIECTAPYVLVGLSCISHVNYPDCESTAGYTATRTSDGEICDVLPLPWNSAGAVRLLTDILLVSRIFNLSIPSDGPIVHVFGADSTFESGGGLYSAAFATGTNMYVNAGQVCTLTETISSSQDMPLVARYCKTTQYHAIYMVKTVGTYKYVQLKRSFGNNNKYLMWKVSSSQAILRVWRLPGRVTSMSHSVIGGTNYIYLVFEGVSFVSFAAETSPATDTGCGYMRQLAQQSVVTVCSNAQILAGVDAVGQADGWRDVARFEAELSIAVGTDPKRVFVLDAVNCRLAEIWIDTPGSAFTAVGTIVAACFNTGAIPNGRLLTSVLGGAMLLFQADNGIWQVDIAFRDLQLIVPDAEIAVEVSWIGANSTAVLLWSPTQVQIITPVEESCADGFFSSVGGVCKACAIGQYSVGYSCLNCTTPSCDAGYEVSPCTGGADAHCVQCASDFVPSSAVYVKGCEWKRVGPCEIGYYAAHVGDDCTQCPGGVWGTTAHAGATAASDCFCARSGVLLTTNPPTCQVASPYAGGTAASDIIPEWLYGMGCTAPNPLMQNQDRCDAVCATDAIDCEPCGATGLYLQQVNPRICSACPSGTVGLNGLFCKTCEGLREPTLLRDSCICKAPGVWVPPSGCACPAGHILDADGAVCTTCPESSVRVGLLPLSDSLNTPRDLEGCEECPPGFTSDATFTVCRPCAAGLYREVGQSSCAACAVSGTYAKDPAASASCTTCSASCGVGFRAVPCPLDKELFECRACPDLVFPQEWVQSATNDKCYWTCPGGYYLGSSGCVQCTSPECPAGFLSSACSTYADASCDISCVNATMPLQNAHFSEACAWECDAGYKQVETVYEGWADYVCESVV